MFFFRGREKKLKARTIEILDGQGHRQKMMTVTSCQGHGQLVVLPDGRKIQLAFVKPPGRAQEPIKAYVAVR